jgi:uncharacterized protein (TIGR02246 family)
MPAAHPPPSAKDLSMTKTTIVLAILAAVLRLPLVGATSSVEEVRRTVEAFYDAFNAHDFSRVAEFTAEEWVHINPFGGQKSGREEVLKSLREVHGTFLKGVTDKPEKVEVKFASPEVAVVTVPSRMSPHTTPDGVRRENQGQIRTFVVCLRKGRWLILQDQNTFRP